MLFEQCFGILKNFLVSKDNKNYSQILRNFPDLREPEHLNFCNSGQSLETSKKTPEAIHTFLECGSGAIARSGIGIELRCFLVLKKLLKKL